MPNDLSDHLILSSPTDITRKGIWDKLGSDYLSVAPAFRFRRSREVPVLATNKLLEALREGDLDLWHRKNALFAIRDFLETQWVPDDADADVAMYQSAAKSYVSNYTRVEGSTDELHCLCVTSEGIKPMPVPTGAVIATSKDPDTGAISYFQLSTNSARELTAANFTDTKESYEAAWDTLVDVVKRVYPTATPTIVSHSFLDLSVGAVMQRYPYLYKQYNLTKKVQTSVEKRIEGEADYVTVQALFKEAQELNQRLAQLKRDLSGLVGYAASKGYLLFQTREKLSDTAKGKITETVTAEPGDLFTVRRFVTKWVEEKTLYHSKRRFLRSTKRWTTTQRFHKSAEDADYTKIENSDSMMSEFISNELVDYNAIILLNVASGLQSEDGRSLASIMSQCELDEGYRKTCALLMPVYNQNLFGNDVIAGYHVIKSPSRGRRIASMPEFYFEESISYRLRWSGLELGELLTSINLLPGEIRDISVKTTRTSIREEERKTSQVFETDANTSFDTVSSIENEFQRENTSEKTKSWSVKASGSYGGFSAGGSASGSSKQTARQFAKSLNKLTTQAISKMRKQSRSEVTARNLSRDEMETSASSTGHISNPNVGRTLNVNYYAINNVFASSTYIDDIAFTYVSPFELIDGTDIREVKSFTKEELPEFLDSVFEDITEMLLMGLRFENGDVSRAERRVAAEALARTYVENLQADFTGALLDYSTSPSENKMDTEKQPVQAFDVKVGVDDPRPINLKKDKNFEDLIGQLTATGKAIEPDIVISPSAAFYADATTGHSEGLESYAVDMRKLEVEKQFADVIKMMETSSTPIKSDRKAHYNVSHQLGDGNTLSINVGGDVGGGKWIFRIGSTPFGTLTITTGKSAYKLKLTAAQAADVKNLSLPGSLVRDA